MKQNIIQLVNDVAIIVDDETFQRVRRQWTSLFSFRKYITIVDNRNHSFTVRKKHIFLLEESYAEKETSN